MILENIKLFIILFLLIILFNFNYTPFISVIVPVYNNQRYLPFCLQSIISQSLKNIEILCIDDGSKDESNNIIKNFSKIDKRIILIFQNNKGPGIARNEGIKRSKGKYLAFMDSDDLYPNNYCLELLYNTCIENNALVCGGILKRFKKIDGHFKVVEVKEDNNKINMEGLFNYSSEGFDFGFYRFIYNSNFIKRNNIFFPNYLRYQDPPFLINAMIKAKQFYNLNFPTYLYRKSHKKIDWNFRKIFDQYNGFKDCLLLLQKYNLNKLFCKVVNRLNLDLFLLPTKKFINDKNITKHIYNILKIINFSKLQNEYCSLKLNTIYKLILKKNKYLE